MNDGGNNNDGDRQSDDDGLPQERGEELRSYCKSESLSEEGLHQIIKRYGWTTDTTHHLKMDYGFFHAACENERVNEGIIRCLLEYFPHAISAVDEYGQDPLHCACGNKNVTLGIIQLLVNAAPDSVRSKDNYDESPLHYLCNGIKVDETAAIQILKLLIEKCPEAVRHANSNGHLPIHFAADTQSPEFCRLLIEAYPGSEQIPSADGTLPLHLACGDNISVATVEYLYQQYPNAIDHATTDGHYPIHCAISSTKCRKIPATGVDIVRFLLDCDPNQKLKQVNGKSLLQYACDEEMNNYSNVEEGIEIMKILLNAHPDSVCSEDNDGQMPLHVLSSNEDMDEASAIKILKLLIEKGPEALRHADNDGDLPIHLAASRKSPEFCRLLIKTYPESAQITDAYGALPLHLACQYNTLAAVEYLYQRHPDAINHATTEGFYPIHYAIDMDERDDPTAALDIVRFLLDCDPNEKLKQLDGKSLLHYAFEREYNETNVEAGIQMIETIFDAHPEAIEDDTIAANVQRFHQQVQEFINGELVYARQAKDHRLMMTPDANGQLPLHTALQNNVRLGSIKLLVKVNPSAIRNSDNNLAMPLHIASEHHNSASVVQYLLDQLDTKTLRAVDIDNNTALHYACRGAKHDTIALLLKTYAASVSKRNADEKVPIDLLWESDEVSDRESVEYTGSVFQLLRAHPEMLAISNWIEKQSNDADSTRHGKKRKSGAV